MKPINELPRATILQRSMDQHINTPYAVDRGTPRWTATSTLPLVWTSSRSRWSYLRCVRVSVDIPQSSFIASTVGRNQWPESCFGAENSDRKVQNVVTDSRASFRRVDFSREPKEDISFYFEWLRHRFNQFDRSPILLLIPLRQSESGPRNPSYWF